MECRIYASPVKVHQKTYWPQLLADSSRSMMLNAVIQIWTSFQPTQLRTQPRGRHYTMSAVDVAELWGVCKTHSTKSRMRRISSPKSELNATVLFQIENQHSQTHVFNFARARGKLTSSKANSEPWRSSKHDTIRHEGQNEEEPLWDGWTEKSIQGIWEITGTFSWQKPLLFQVKHLRLTFDLMSYVKHT